jgi:hypothetical protein
VEAEERGTSTTLNVVLSATNTCDLDNRTRLFIGVGVSVGLVLVLIVVGLILLFVWRKRKLKFLEEIFSSAVKERELRVLEAYRQK